MTLGVTEIRFIARYIIQKMLINITRYL